MTSTTVNTMYDEVSKLSQDALKQINYTIDEYIVKSVENVSLDIFSSNESVMRLRSSMTYDILQSEELYNSLVQYKNTYEFIHSIIVYIPKRDRIFTDSGTWDAAFYPDILKFYTSDIDDFIAGEKNKDWTGAKTIKDFMNDNEETGIVSFIRGYYRNQLRNDEYYVIINVYWNDIIDSIQRLDASSEKYLLILNRDGTILYQNDYFNRLEPQSRQQMLNRLIIEKKTDTSFWMRNEDLLVTSVTSSTTNWIYVIADPIDSISASRNLIIKLLLMICVGSIFIGFIVSGILARKLNAPVSNMLKAIKRLNSGEEVLYEIGGMGHGIMDLSRQISKYKDSIADNLSAIKLNTIMSVLDGRIKDRQVLNEKLQLMNRSFDYNSFVTLVAELDRYYELVEMLTAEEMEILKLKLTETIESSLNTIVPCVACEYGENRIVFLVNGQDIEGSFRQIAKTIKEIADNFENQWQVTVSIAAGSIQNGISGCGVSYRHAEQTIRYKYYYGTGSFLEYGEIMSLFVNRTAFPTEIFNRFSEALGKADINGMTEVIGEFESFILTNNLEYESYKNTISEFSNKLFGVISKYEISLEEITSANLKCYKDNDGVTILSDFIKWLTSLTCQIIQVIEKNKTDRYRNLIREVLEYINNNLDKDIRFETVAENVYISPNYLSKIFKHETGVSFTDYVIDAKIDYSRILLEQGNMKIQDIAGKIGYANPQYYIKVFKNKYGITPKQYQIECSRKKLSE